MSWKHVFSIAVKYKQMHPLNLHFPSVHRCLWSMPTPATAKRLRGCWQAAPSMESLSWLPSTLWAPIKEVTSIRLSSELLNPQFTPQRSLHVKNKVHQWVAALQFKLFQIWVSVVLHAVFYSKSVFHAECKLSCGEPPPSVCVLFLSIQCFNIY